MKKIQRPLQRASETEKQDAISTTLQKEKQEKVEKILWGVKVSPYVRKFIVTLEENIFLMI